MYTKMAIIAKTWQKYCGLGGGRSPFGRPRHFHRRAPLPSRVGLIYLVADAALTARALAAVSHCPLGPIQRHRTFMGDAHARLDAIARATRPPAGCAHRLRPHVPGMHAGGLRFGSWQVHAGGAVHRADPPSHDRTAPLQLEVSVPAPDDREGCGALQLEAPPPSHIAACAGAGTTNAHGCDHCVDMGSRRCAHLRCAQL